DLALFLEIVEYGDYLFVPHHSDSFTPDFSRVNFNESVFHLFDCHRIASGSGRRSRNPSCTRRSAAPRKSYQPHFSSVNVGVIPAIEYRLDTRATSYCSASALRVARISSPSSLDDTMMSSTCTLVRLTRRSGSGRAALRGDTLL